LSGQFKITNHYSKPKEITYNDEEEEEEEAPAGGEAEADEEKE
jgi:hypothetical protein